MADGGETKAIDIKVGDWFYDTKKQLNIEVTTLYPNNEVILQSIDYNKNGAKNTFSMPLHILKSKVKGGSYFKIPKSNIKKADGGYMADGGLVVKSDEDLREIAKYMAKAVKKNADLKDLVYYFEQENNYDYKYRVKIWDEMNVWEMKKTEENIYKVLKAIVEANEGGKMEKGGYYAKGGLTEHGLKVGDTIVDNMFWDKSVKVLNSKTGYAVVHLETGERKEMKAMGGEMHRTQE
jgi:hypothetical protein